MKNRIKSSITRALLCGLFLSMLFPAQIATANSGVIEDLNPPNFELRVDADTPIAVTKEDLILEAKRNPWSNFFDVTYELQNTSDAPVTQPLIFPLIGNIQTGLRLAAGLDVFALEKNGEPLPFALSFGMQVPEGETPDFEEMLANRNSQEAITPFLSQMVTVTDFSVDPPEKGEVWVDLDPVKGDSLLVVNTGGSFDNRNGKFSYGLNRDSAVDPSTPWTGSVVQIGQTEEPPKLRARAVDQGEAVQQDLPIATQKRELTLYDFLSEWQDQFGFLEEGIYNETTKPAVLTTIGTALEYDLAARQVVDDHSIRQYFFTDRAIFFSYALPMEGGETATHHIRYGVQPTYLRGSFGAQDYKYTYLLNPARGWKEFGNLNLTIQTDGELKLANSSLPLQKKGSDYTASFDTLPEEDLVVHLTDPSMRSPLIQIAIPGLFIALLVLVGFMIRRKKRQRSK